ncbi:hypothetical protein ACJJTC_008279 [Scirpophaga incertulas]
MATCMTQFRDVNCDCNRSAVSCVLAAIDQPATGTDGTTSDCVPPLRGQRGEGPASGVGRNRLVRRVSGWPGSAENSAPETNSNSKDRYTYTRTTSEEVQFDLGTMSF